MIRPTLASIDTLGAFDELQTAGLDDTAARAVVDAINEAITTMGVTADDIGSVETRLGEMTGDSRENTQQILSDLAGIRAEQIHLARRLGELRGEIRAELRNSRVATEPDLRPVVCHRRIMSTLAFIVPILLLLLLGVLALLIPGETRALLHDLWVEGPIWFGERP